MRTLFLLIGDVCNMKGQGRRQVKTLRMAFLLLNMSRRNFASHQTSRRKVIPSKDLVKWLRVMPAEISIEKISGMQLYTLEF